MKIDSANKEESIRQAVKAFLGGAKDMLREVEHSDEIAMARRRMFKVIDGGLMNKQQPRKSD